LHPRHAVASLQAASCINPASIKAKTGFGKAGAVPGAAINVQRMPQPELGFLFA
jgi:hypothetical protein